VKERGTLQFSSLLDTKEEGGYKRKEDNDSYEGFDLKYH
jgi:hypothetical protein